ncbi:MAG: hypothetical protein HYU33_00720 [Candidatus Omnitrophica bacterium]|nr:hypothetical protein [Candidatus Omnitrophota bacterium]MBI3009909.1 hypothetical protein [Candidatus Omnitrophota bacterium]
MNKVLLTMLEEENEDSLTNTDCASLMTPLGLVEGEVLTYLERHQSTTLRRLNRELEWPAYMVMMGVGALIRVGLVRGIQHDLEVVLKLRKPLALVGY